MNKLSGVIITFNEEKNIERCLKSISEVVDEIIVLDSFSTDRTEEICKNYNVKFVQHKFDGHIQQKNRAKNMAAFDYVLSLDADEALSEELKKEILHIKKDFKYDSYSFNRLTSYCGKWIRHGNWYPDRKLRIWKKDKGNWGGLNPHDQVIMDENTNHKVISGDLLHYSFYSIDEHLIQIQKFTTISANAYLVKGRKTSCFQIVFKPLWFFIRGYILRRGFLDGFYGLVIAANSAHAIFLKLVKLRQLLKNKAIE